MREGDLHVHVDVLSRRRLRWTDIESPQDPRDVQRNGVIADMQPGAYSSSPTKGAVSECAWVVSLFEEAFRLEIVRIRKVCLVQMDW